MDYVPHKYWYLPTRLHGVTFQMNVILKHRICYAMIRPWPILWYVVFFWWNIDTPPPHFFYIAQFLIRIQSGHHPNSPDMLPLQQCSQKMCYKRCIYWSSGKLFKARPFKQCIKMQYSAVRIRWHMPRSRILSFSEIDESMWLGRGNSSVDYWQPRCANKLVAFVLCCRGYAPRPREACWIPTPFSCCPFTSPPTHRRMPCHINCALRASLYRHYSSTTKTNQSMMLQNNHCCLW
jgi:hypothetical protein